MRLAGVIIADVTAAQEVARFPLSVRKGTSVYLTTQPFRGFICPTRTFFGDDASSLLYTCARVWGE